MQSDQLDILEEKINNAVLLIAKLQAENGELKKQTKELTSRLQENEKIIQQIREENQKIKEQKGNPQDFQEKEEKIRQKIEGMLAKLDSY